MPRTHQYQVVVGNNAGEFAKAVRDARIRHPGDPYDPGKDIPRGATCTFGVFFEDLRAAMGQMMSGQGFPTADKLQLTFTWTDEDEQAEAGGTPPVIELPSAFRDPVPDERDTTIKPDPED